jgi:multidrug efflux pump subunit AcrA (membrane-fusion protein)
VVPTTSGSKRKWLILLAIIVIVGIGWWVVSRRQAAAQPQNIAAAPVVRTAKVVTGSLRATLRLAGATSARNFSNVVAPMMRGPDSGRALVLIYLPKSGSFVKKGEVVARIDAQSVKDHVDDVHAQVVTAEADIRKREAEQAIAMENVRQQLRVAKSELDKAQLDFKTAEVRTPIDMEILKLAVEEAEENYRQLEKNLPITQELHKSEIKILGYTRDRHARHRDRHAIDVERFTLTAAMSGLAVMNQVFRGGEMGQIQEGDQVSPGQPFMKIVDSSSMQLDATVNQVDGEMMRVGQPATVEFDAFPGLKLNGKVAALGAMGVSSWRQNYFIRTIPVRVAISGSDNRVIPDLSASADVVLSEEQNTTIVPLEAVHWDAGKAFVYVKNGERFDRRTVELGRRNDLQAAIVSGVKAGEEVALSTPPLSAAR